MLYKRIYQCGHIEVDAFERDAEDLACDEYAARVHDGIAHCRRHEVTVRLEAVEPDVCSLSLEVPLCYRHLATLQTVASVCCTQTMTSSVRDPWGWEDLFDCLS